jgi:hypothetical protein
MTELFRFAKAEDPRDQPLLTAARVSLEDDPTPRMIRFMVDQEGNPIEIPMVVTSQPQE